MLSGFLLVYVAYSMGSQIHLAILLVWQLVFSLIEPHVVLDKQEYLVGKIGWPEGSGEVDLF